MDYYEKKSIVVRRNIRGLEVKNESRFLNTVYNYIKYKFDKTGTSPNIEIAPLNLDWDQPVSRTKRPDWISPVIITMFGITKRCFHRTT